MQDQVTPDLMRILVDGLKPFSVELEERRTIPCTSYPFASSNSAR